MKDKNSYCLWLLIISYKHFGQCNGLYWCDTQNPDQKYCMLLYVTNVWKIYSILQKSEEMLLKLKKPTTKMPIRGGEISRWHTLWLSLVIFSAEEERKWIYSMCRNWPFSIPKRKRTEGWRRKRSDGYCYDSCYIVSRDVSICADIMLFMPVHDFVCSSICGTLLLGFVLVIVFVKARHSLCNKNKKKNREIETREIKFEK